MAGFAIQRFVQTGQREARGAVVKTVAREYLPSGGAVACPAGTAQPALVRVTVTTVAVAESHPAKTGEGPVGIMFRFVAAFAGHVLVAPVQPETGIGMIEAGHRFPFILIMAVETIFGKLAAVRVFVTGEAITLQPQKSARKILARIFQRFTVYNIFRIVAVAAFHLLVRPLQFKTCFGMAEVFHTLWPVDQIKITALVLDMATAAIVITALRVQPFTGINPLRQQRMAIQAF